jgi:hypothetical protein
MSRAHVVEGLGEGAADAPGPGGRVGRVAVAGESEQVVGDQSQDLLGVRQRADGGVAERLAADGLAVVVGYRADAAEAHAAVARITAAGGHATSARADVADDDAVTALFDTAEQRCGGVGVVVHAAGVMRLAPVAELDLDDLDLMYRTNLRGCGCPKLGAPHATC